MDKESLLHTIRDRYSVAKHIVRPNKTNGSSYAEGYFDGWYEATLIILNYLDRTDLVSEFTVSISENQSKDL